jgi:hypothetical protein
MSWLRGLESNEEGVCIAKWHRGTKDFGFGVNKLASHPISHIANGTKILFSNKA